MTVLLNGQDFAVGAWREHLPYNNVVSIAQVGSKTYAATEFSLYSIDESRFTQPFWTCLRKCSSVSTNFASTVVCEPDAQNSDTSLIIFPAY